MRSAALALLEAGADVSISPVALHRLERPYVAPRGWDRGRDRMAA
jgi:hypothetical protein